MSVLKKWLRAGTSLSLVILLGIFATACGVSEEELSKIKTQGDRYLAQGLDPEGYSKADIEKMSDREQYELFKKRYERMHEVAGDVMTAAAGPAVEWKVLAFGFVPFAGGRGQNPMPRGAKSEDTYVFDMALFLDVEGPLDYKTVVESMRAWMIEQDYSVGEIGDDPAAPVGLRFNGLTQDGFLVDFSAGEGFMHMNVFAGPYWGNARELGQLLAGNPQELLDQFEFILPYEFLPFPEFRGDKTY